MGNHGLNLGPSKTFQFLTFVVDVVGAVDCPAAAWNFGTNSGAFAQDVVEELTGDVVAAIIAGWIWTNPPTSPERL